MLKTASPPSPLMSDLRRPTLSALDDNSRPCSPDVALGAYLISHLQARCENCGTSDTPQWRKGWHSDLLGRNVILCNACGLKYNKNQYCPYCMFVYYKEEDKKDMDQWVACDECQRWVHIECEMNCGENRHFSPFDTYRCPSCRSRPPKPSKAPSTHRHHRRDSVADDSSAHDSDASMMDTEGPPATSGGVAPSHAAAAAAAAPTTATTANTGNLHYSLPRPDYHTSQQLMMAEYAAGLRGGPPHAN